MEVGGLDESNRWVDGFLSCVFIKGGAQLALEEAVAPGLYERVKLT